MNNPNQDNNSGPLLNIIGSTDSFDNGNGSPDLTFLAEPWSDSDESELSSQENLTKEEMNMKIENVEKSSIKNNLDNEQKINSPYQNDISFSNSMGPPKDISSTLSPSKDGNLPPPPKNLGYSIKPTDEKESPKDNIINPSIYSLPNPLNNTKSSELLKLQTPLFDSSKGSLGGYTRGRKSRQKANKYPTQQIGRYDPEVEQIRSHSSEKKYGENKLKSSILPPPPKATSFEQQKDTKENNELENKNEEILKTENNNDKKSDKKSDKNEISGINIMTPTTNNEESVESTEKLKSEENKTNLLTVEENQNVTSPYSTTVQGDEGNLNDKSSADNVLNDNSNTIMNKEEQPQSETTPISYMQYPTTTQQYNSNNQQYNPTTENQQYNSINQQYSTTNETQQYDLNSQQQYNALENQQYNPNNQQYNATTTDVNQQYDSNNQQYNTTDVNQQYDPNNQQYNTTDVNQQYDSNNQQYNQNNQQYNATTMNQQYDPNDPQYASYYAQYGYNCGYGYGYGYGYTDGSAKPEMVESSTMTSDVEENQKPDTVIKEKKIKTSSQGIQTLKNTKESSCETSKIEKNSIGLQTKEIVLKNSSVLTDPDQRRPIYRQNDRIPDGVRLPATTVEYEFLKDDDYLFSPLSSKQLSMTLISKSTESLESHSNNVSTSIITDKNNKYISYIDGSNIHVIEEKRQFKFVLGGHSSNIIHISFATIENKYTRLLSIDEDGVIIVHEFDESKNLLDKNVTIDDFCTVIMALQSMEYQIYCASFQPNNPNCIVVGTNQKCALYFNIEDQLWKRKINPEDDSDDETESSDSLSSDTSSSDEELRKKKKERRRRRKEKKREKRRRKFIQKKEQEREDRLKYGIKAIKLEHGSNVKCLTFNTDGSILATGGEDGLVRLWNMNEICDFQIPFFYYSPVRDSNDTRNIGSAKSITSLEFACYFSQYSIDALLIVGSNKNRRIQVLDTYNFKVLHELNLGRKTSWKWDEKLKSLLAYKVNEAMLFSFHLCTPSIKSTNELKSPRKSSLKLKLETIESTQAFKFHSESPFIFDSVQFDYAVGWKLNKPIHSFTTMYGVNSGNSLNKEVKSKWYILNRHQSTLESCEVSIKMVAPGCRTACPLLGSLQWDIDEMWEEIRVKREAMEWEDLKFELEGDSKIERERWEKDFDKKQQAWKEQVERLKKKFENEKRSFLNDEIKAAVENELRIMCKPKVIADLNAELRGSLEDEIKSSLEDELRKECEPQIIESLTEELRNSLEEQVRTTLEKELRPVFEKELKAELRIELEEKLAEEVRQSIENRLRDECKDRVIEELKQLLEPEIKMNLEREIRKEYEPIIKDSLRNELIDDVKLEVEAEVKETIRNEQENVIKEQISNELRESLREEVRSKLEAEIREQVINELKEKLKDEVKVSVEKQLKEEYEPVIRAHMRKELRESLEEEIRETMYSQMKAQIEDELRSTLTEKIKVQIENEERGEFNEKRKSVIESEIRQTLSQTISDELERKWYEENEDKLREKFENELRLSMEKEKANYEKNIQNEMENKRQYIEQEMNKEIEEKRISIEQQLRNEIENQLRNTLQQEMTNEIRNKQLSIEKELQQEIDNKRELMEQTLQQEIKTKRQMMEQTIHNEIESQLRISLEQEIKDQLTEELRPEIEKQLQMEYNNNKITQNETNIDNSNEIEELKNENERMEKEHEDLLMCLYDMEEKVKNYRQKLRDLSALSDSDSDSDSDSESDYNDENVTEEKIENNIEEIEMEHNENENDIEDNIPVFSSIQHSPIVQLHSPIIKQQSPIIQQNSPVIEQNSPIVQLKSPIIKQQSPIIQQQSPIIQQQSPIIQQQSLIIQQSPIIHQQSPIIHQQSPIIHQQSPLIHQQSPLIQQQSPIIQQQSPINQQQSIIQQSPMFTEQSNIPLFNNNLIQSNEQNQQEQNVQEQSINFEQQNEKETLEFNNNYNTQKEISLTKEKKSSFIMTSAPSPLPSPTQKLPIPFSIPSTTHSMSVSPFENKILENNDQQNNTSAIFDSTETAKQQNIINNTLSVEGWDVEGDNWEISNFSDVSFNKDLDNANKVLEKEKETNKNEQNILENNNIKQTDTNNQSVYIGNNMQQPILPISENKEANQDQAINSIDFKNDGNGWDFEFEQSSFTEPNQIQNNNEIEQQKPHSEIITTAIDDNSQLNTNNQQIKSSNTTNTENILENNNKNIPLQNEANNNDGWNIDGWETNDNFMNFGDNQLTTNISSPQPTTNIDNKAEENDSSMFAGKSNQLFSPESTKAQVNDTTPFGDWNNLGLGDIPIPKIENNDQQKTSVESSNGWDSIGFGNISIPKVENTETQKKPSESSNGWDNLGFGDIQIPKIDEEKQTHPSNNSNDWNINDWNNNDWNNNDWNIGNTTTTTTKKENTTINQTNTNENLWNTQKRNSDSYSNKSFESNKEGSIKSSSAGYGMSQKSPSFGYGLSQKSPVSTSFGLSQKSPASTSFGLSQRSPPSNFGILKSPSSGFYSGNTKVTSPYNMQKSPSLNITNKFSYNRQTSIFSSSKNEPSLNNPMQSPSFTNKTSDSPGLSKYFNETNKGGKVTATQFVSSFTNESTVKKNISGFMEQDKSATTNPLSSYFTSPKSTSRTNIYSKQSSSSSLSMRRHGKSDY